MERKKRILILSFVLILPTFLLVYQTYSKSTQNIKTDSSSVLNLQTDTYEETRVTQYTGDTRATEEINPTDSSPTPTINTEIGKTILKSVSLDSYKSTLTTSTYVIKAGDTVSNILRNYEDTCNYMTGVKHLEIFNPQVDLNNLEINSTLNFPTTAFTNGRLYKVVSGDTWYKIAKENYSEYKTDDIINFLISINDLPSSDLPLGENVFLPNL